MSDPIHFTESARFQAAIRWFDEENSKDPNIDVIEGRPVPRELAQARQLSQWVLRLAPEAPEWLRLAARCQHLCRWKSPRNSYPMTRAGYLKWREELKKLHARLAGEILRECGYEEDLIDRVQALNLKKHFPNDPDSRVLEDALCLFFLERQLEELATRTDDDKLINALRKSWNKMTPGAQQLALDLPMGERGKSLIARALKGD